MEVCVLLLERYVLNPVSLPPSSSALGTCVRVQPLDADERAEAAEKARIANAAAAATGALLGEAEGLWNEAGPWPETYVLLAGGKGPCMGVYGALQRASVCGCDGERVGLAVADCVCRYRVGLKLPSVPLKEGPTGTPTPLFVNFVVSVHIDAELAEKEAADWAKADAETRVNRGKERGNREERKQVALARAIKTAEVRAGPFHAEPLLGALL